MKTQHEFPEDWRKISNEEAISHIKYLLEHYKEYNIEKYGNTLTINGIIIAPMNLNIYDYKMFLVAKKVYGSTEDIYPMIQQLIDVCNVEINKRKAEKAIEANKKKRIIFTVISSAFIIAAIAGTVYMINDIFKIIDKERAKQIKIENEIKRYEKTLPYYNEYLQTKQQIQNRRDSLKKVY
ncbi:MAG: hypothetical protein IKP35_03070 [Alphaproteobacteria bacterium]|nr:hypothetical protein [Alphaproteobacteria bacterium]